jgi:hypothetical protein
LPLGATPNRVEQPQKILVSVVSWQWVSSPIMVSYWVFTVLAMVAILMMLFNDPSSLMIAEGGFSSCLYIV